MIPGRLPLFLALLRGGDDRSRSALGHESRPPHRQRYAQQLKRANGFLKK